MAKDLLKYIWCKLSAFCHIPYLAGRISVMLHATAVWLWFCPDEVGSLWTQKKLDTVMSGAGQQRVKAEDWPKTFLFQGPIWM